MTKRLKGALLVGQSGGPTAVINCSLVGVIQEAAKHEEIDNIYGMVHGIEGALKENLTDLKKERPETIQGLLNVPASALGSCRHKVTPKDFERIMQIFETHNVRYFTYIGGNDSMDTADRIAALAAKDGYELRVMGIPKTIDNDLAHTDHSPGYGSAARFLAMAAMDVGRDLEAMKTFDNVIIMETLGRHAGWLPAAAALAKKRHEDAPHLVYVPERAFDENEFLEDVKAIYKEIGRVFVVVPAFLRDAKGDIIGADNSKLQKDAFGHTLMSQSSSTPAGYLRELVAQKLNLKARLMLPGLIGRDASTCVSRADQDEAYLMGKQAVMHAVQGDSVYMVTLMRETGPTYRCTTGLVPLAEVANAEKLLPKEFVNERGNGITEAFREYAMPLLGDPLPEYARLERFSVPKLVS
jgi:6-phosphofructokinase 1